MFVPHQSEKQPKHFTEERGGGGGAVTEEGSEEKGINECEGTRKVCVFSEKEEEVAACRQGQQNAVSADHKEETDIHFLTCFASIQHQRRAATKEEEEKEELVSRLKQFCQ